MVNIDMTMGDAIRHVAEQRPDQEVLVCGPTRLTNKMLLARIEDLARGLAGLGIRKGDRIVALLPPGPEFVYLFFAASRLGAIILPLNTQLRERALKDILGDAHPLALVTAQPVAPEVLQQAAGMRHIIQAGGEGNGLSLASLMKEGQPALPPVALAPTDLLALMYTSGTTGKPKATMHTHRSLIAPAVASLKVRELWSRPSTLRTLVEVAKAVARYRARLLRSIGRPQTFLSTMGWHSITGLHVMLQGVLMGDRLVAMPRFHPEEALALVERERVTVLVAVPMAYQAMMALPGFSRFDTSSLLVCGTGAAPCPPSLAREIQQRFNCAVYIGFGMTEAAGGIAVGSLADTDAQQAETVGRPLPGIDTRIVDEQRHDLPLGEVGELAVRGDGVMMGYYQAPELTAEVIDEAGWLYTGDLATMDEKGYLRIVGRKKDLIIRGGQNIYPAEIESYLDSHPKIEEAAIVGVPAAVGGESVWAFLRLKENARMTAQEVLDYCRGALEPYKIPSQVRFVSEFPQAEPGKTQKLILRAMAAQELKGGAA
ncbi:MAG: class I adenylate-forming enzyme family protein [Spirochaetia bacterium]|jgi:acyl-CoA synthetase (AMP-forming)/AMP-acid ligase II